MRRIDDHTGCSITWHGNNTTYVRPQLIHQDSVILSSVQGKPKKYSLPSQEEVTDPWEFSHSVQETPSPFCTSTASPFNNEHWLSRSDTVISNKSKGI